MNGLRVTHDPGVIGFDPYGLVGTTNEIIPRIQELPRAKFWAIECVFEPSAPEDGRAGIERLRPMIVHHVEAVREDLLS
jgi:hypothetical protein